MPSVINRYHYLPTDGVGPKQTRTGRERRPKLPDPWIYGGRGTPLGNPFRRQDYVGEDPEGRPMAISLYRRHLWKLVKADDPRIWMALRSIQPDTHLVCSCAPKPCHLDEVVKLWHYLETTGRLHPSP